MVDKYQIGKQFSAGFAAALIPKPRVESNSTHWLAGWDAGYELRGEKHDRMNKYLVSIGVEPMGVVRLAGPAASAGGESTGGVG